MQQQIHFILYMYIVQVYSSNVLSNVRKVNDKVLKMVSMRLIWTYCGILFPRRKE